MQVLRRLSISVGFAVGLVSVLAVATVAASGGFGFGVGQFTFSDTSAFNSFFNPVDQSNVNVSVDRGTFLFKPRGGGGFTHSHMTVLNVNVFTPNPDPTMPPLVDAFGCFVIPDADFVVSSDLQAASLNATVDETNLCPGFLAPVLGAVVGKAGGGGGGSAGFNFPLTVSGNWIGTGAVQEQTDQGRFTCQTFSANTHNDSRFVQSSFVATSISGFGTFSGPNSFGQVDVTNQVMQVTGQGILSAPCGGGKG